MLLFENVTNLTASLKKRTQDRVAGILGLRLKLKLLSDIKLYVLVIRRRASLARWMGPEHEHEKLTYQILASPYRSDNIIC